MPVAFHSLIRCASVILAGIFYQLRELAALGKGLLVADYINPNMGELCLLKIRSG